MTGVDLIFVSQSKPLRILYKVRDTIGAQYSSSSSSIYYARENGPHRACGYAKLFTLFPAFRPFYTKESPTALPVLTFLAPFA
ncbi:Uncharacterized protein HZ326_29742 [Fusarium oxysporum f. sp. albedinis]|nr:Uncharacterized protein HZ326_29742 [Fusarium oxysporum f. sp. albedinis]